MTISSGLACKSFAPHCFNPKISLVWFWMWCHASSILRDNPSKIWWFLSFHISQSTNLGKTSQILFKMEFLKDFFAQVSSISWRLESFRSSLPNISSPYTHTSVTQIQSWIRWGVVSSAWMHKTNRDGSIIPLLFSFPTWEFCPS